MLLEKSKRKTPLGFFSGAPEKNKACKRNRQERVKIKM